jgi:hypothetical protein
LDEALQASDVDLAGVVFLVALTRCDESDLVFLAAKNAATGKTPDAVETTVSHGFEWRAGVGPKVPSPLIGCSPDATLRSSGEERMAARQGGTGSAAAQAQWWPSSKIYLLSSLCNYVSSSFFHN